MWRGSLFVTPLHRLKIQHLFHLFLERQVLWNNSEGCPKICIFPPFRLHIPSRFKFLYCAEVFFFINIREFWVHSLGVFVSDPYWNYTRVIITMFVKWPCRFSSQCEKFSWEVKLQWPPNKYVQSQFRSERNIFAIILINIFSILELVMKVVSTKRMVHQCFAQE